MNTIANKPYKPIWYTIPLLIGLSILGLNATIDIPLHDIYFVISSIHIGMLLSGFLGIIGVIYWLMRKIKLINWLTIIHVVITISAFVTFMIYLIFKSVIEYFGFSIIEYFEAFPIINQIVTIILLMAFFSQFIFIANLILSLIRNQKNDYV